MYRLRSILVASSLLAGLLSPVLAQEISQADITFWQSIKNSDNPEEYRAYLEAFPEGAFAELAQLRIETLGGGGAPGKRKGGGDDPAETELAEDDAPAGDVLSDAVLTVTPAEVRVGDTIKVTFTDLPKPSSSDIVVIVPAGSPDSMGATTTEGVLEYTYISNEYYIANGWESGPFAPGRYEVRWLTTLYNNDDKLQVGARTPFEVGR